MEIKLPKLPRSGIGRIVSAAAVLLAAAAVLFFCRISESFTPIRRCFSVLSPDGTRIAAVECRDQGALGGRTYVYIRNRAEEVRACDPPQGKKIIDVPHLYPDAIELRWIDGDTLRFNGKEYEIR